MYNLYYIYFKNIYHFKNYINEMSDILCFLWIHIQSQDQGLSIVHLLSMHNN